MFLKRNATVSVCHTRTKDINKYIKNADVLVVAVGRANFITSELIKDGAIIIDVGINRVEGKLCGDVNFYDVYEKVSYISPVPGGVGPLTVATLLDNTFLAYKKKFAGNKDWTALNRELVLKLVRITYIEAVYNLLKWIKINKLIINKYTVN